jgi:hypothetical protein
MDDEFVFSLEDVLTNIDTADVMSLFFPAFRKAVVIDTRTNDEEGAMVRILPMAASPQERLRTIRKLRPTFPRLRTLTLIPWPRYVDSLVSMGVWGRIVDRFRNGGHDGVLAECDAVLAELRGLEQLELAAVVRGENYHTLWSATE